MLITEVAHTLHRQLCIDNSASTFQLFTSLLILYSGFYWKDEGVTDLGYKLCCQNYRFTAGVNLTTTANTLSYGTMMPHFNVEKLNAADALKLSQSSDTFKEWALTTH